MTIVFVYDISDPTNPVELSQWADAGAKPTGFVVNEEEDHLFLALTECFDTIAGGECNRRVERYDTSDGGLYREGHYSAGGSGRVGPLALGAPGTAVVWDAVDGLVLVGGDIGELGRVGTPTAVDWQARAMAGDRDQILVVDEIGAPRLLSLAPESDAPIVEAPPPDELWNFEAWSVSVR